MSAYDPRGWQRLVVMLVAAGLCACSKSPSTTTADDAGPGQRDLSETVAAFAPDGWQLASDVSEFTAENLYEQINGRAELYLSYDVARLTFAGFEDAAGPRRFVDLSIYDMGSPTNAFGIFSVERSRDEPSVDLGRAGYRSGANYYVWKGQYYIQVIASDATDLMQQVGFDLARQATDLLDETGEPVWGLTAMPQDGLVPDSIRYFKVDAMSLDFLSNTYTAEYRHGDDVVTVFLSRQDSVQAAKDVVNRYIEFAEQYGQGSERVSGDDVAFVVCSMDDAYDVIFQKGLLIGGVTSVDDRSLAVKAAGTLWRQLDAG